ncbi:MAG: aminotransferase class I/II-fold pyridoxal phosphate-dependent enzyme [Euryarchaeota archaeon]|nr:aminotransferase class I/II-fold pyridoxal phosphate-dependent enzyme [Euryarchaeota archaeon]
MPAEKKRSFDTRAVHGSQRKGHAPLAEAIFPTTTWRLDDAKQGARFAQAIHPQQFYTRWGNPNLQTLEETVASLEGGETALAVGSGMAAISTAVITALDGGKRIAAQRALYSATMEMFTGHLKAANIETTFFLKQYGVETTFFDPTKTGDVDRALTPGTKIVYIETPANPTMEITDIAQVARVAHKAGAIVIADNTFATPYNQRPLEFGVDVVVHSMTKGISGHSDVTGGIIVGKRSFIEKAWLNYKILGQTLGPIDAWLASRGLKTLHLRAERQNRNAARLAELLANHPKVQKTNYPGLKSHPQHALAAKQMTGFGGMLSFEIKGGYEAGKRFAESVEVATLAVSLGGVETLVQHPASMTHGPVSAEDRQRAGINDSLIRVSCGIEATEDLVADFEQALAKA